MSFVLSLDQRSTSSRAILFARDGTVHATWRIAHSASAGFIEIGQIAR